MVKVRKATSSKILPVRVHEERKALPPMVCAVCKGRGTVWNISMDRFIKCQHCDEGVVDE